MGTTTPTLSLGVKQLQLLDKHVAIRDYAGQKQFRHFWLDNETWGYSRKKTKQANRYPVFVVDSTETNPVRWLEAGQWYQEIERAFQTVDLLIATKYDLLVPQTITPVEIIGRMKLATSPDILFMSARTGFNVKHGFIQLIGAQKTELTT